MASRFSALRHMNHGASWNDWRLFLGFYLLSIASAAAGSPASRITGDEIVAAFERGEELPPEAEQAVQNLMRARRMTRAEAVRHLAVCWEKSEKGRIAQPKRSRPGYEQETSAPTAVLGVGLISAGALLLALWLRARWRSQASSSALSSERLESLVGAKQPSDHA